jgi:hypothetical protein
MREVSIWRAAFACLLGAALALALYQHFWAKRISAESTATTSILIPWFTGDDAGYSSLLAIENTSMSPYSSAGTSGTCTVDAYDNGSLAGSGSLGTFSAGTITTLTEAQVATATNLSLANSGQRAYLYLTCSFPYAQAQLLFVNPGGVISYFPGQAVPSSQTNPQAPPVIGPAPKKP